jgi:hypothetical protein
LSAGAAQISTFQAGNGGWHLGTLAIGNLDADPALEIVVPYRNPEGQWFLDAFNHDGTRLPGFPYASPGQEMNVSPTLADLDGDGRLEILTTRGNKVLALRANGSVLWSSQIDSSNYVPNGGYQTVTNGFWWSADRAFRSHLPSTAVFSSPVSPPIVADVLANGKLQVITGWKIDPDPGGSEQDFNPFIGKTYGYIEWGITGETWSGGVAFMNATTGAKNFIYHLHHLVECGLAIGQADSDAPLETYVLSDSDSIACFDRTKPHGLWGKGMLHKQFGKSQRLITGSYQLGIDVQTADIDGDGLDEVLVPSTQQTRAWEPPETILDDDGTILWRTWNEFATITNVHGWLNSSCMIPVNPDHDNHADVLTFHHSYKIEFRYWNGAELIDHLGWPKDFFPYVPSPPVVGNVDADDDEEIIIATYNPAQNPSAGHLLIYALDGTLKHSISVPGGVKHIPCLSDVNQDGSLDVVYRSLTGQVYVQNFGARDARSSWPTHRGNYQRDGRRGVSLFPAGTPIIKTRIGGYRRAQFSWSTPSAPRIVRVYRGTGGTYAHIGTLPPGATSYTDTGLEQGRMYFYEIEAVYDTNSVRSCPFVVLSMVNDNLLGNGGFEQNDNCKWDKWFTGDIPMSNMRASTNAFQGERSMEIVLRNHGNNGSIAQFNQYGIPDSSIPVTAGTLYSFGGWFKSGGISQPSEHWFSWSSTKNANTNNRPPPPWPYYFTPHFKVGTRPNGWTYANRMFIMPAGLPNIELQHTYTIAAPGSGSLFIDNVFFRPLPAPAATNWVTAIPFGSTWRFSVAAPDANWRRADFDDSAWAVGRAKFGAGSGPLGVVTSLPQGKAAYYFRNQFVINAPPEEFLLSAKCTDVYPLRIFLNGTELTTSGIEAVTLQGNDVQYYDLNPFIPLLNIGTNTIAVILGNFVNVGWDDVAFDLSLKTIPSKNVNSTRLTISREPSGLFLQAAAPAGTIWKLDACDGPGLNNWRTLQVFTNLSTAPHSVPVSNQGPACFFRLSPY